MSNIVVMPKLGLTMESGIIVKWNHNEGDLIHIGDALLEVEGDKAIVEIESEFEGILLKRYHDVGADVPCKEKIALIGNPSETLPEAIAPQVIPDVAGIVTREATLSPSASGTVEQLPAGRKQGSIASPRARRFARQECIDISLIDKGSGEHGRIVERDVRSYLASTAKAADTKVSPVAKNLMEANNVSMRGLEGSGPDGRIMKIDVMRAIGGQDRRPQKSAMRDTPRKIPLSKMRETIARRLTESKNSIPHYYMRVSANMEYCIAVRDAYALQHPGSRVSLNAVLMKIVALALMQHPDVNSSWSGDGITQYPYADIALAVATESGLITPVVRSCEGKSVLEIDDELKDLVSRAKSGSLKPQEYADHTCTISNLGMHGISEFSAIINPPAASILAIGAIVDTPIAIGSTIAVKPMMHITMSGDHRVIDGAVGAAFLGTLRQLLEQPFFGLF
jgi:pyruvate dehydrogenase E2 component (dihydrolipoamide acetyltransferase)